MNEQDYLMHYGVKGMKWGVRRYQNPDGTRTALGRQHEAELNGREYSGNSSSKSSGSSGSRADRIKKALTSDTAKKVYAGVAVAATVAGAAYLYSRNKGAVDSFVKRNAAKAYISGARAVEKGQDYVKGAISNAKETARARKQDYDMNQNNYTGRKIKNAISREANIASNKLATAGMAAKAHAQNAASKLGSAAKGAVSREANIASNKLATAGMAAKAHAQNAASKLGSAAKGAVSGAKNTVQGLNAVRKGNAYLGESAKRAAGSSGAQWIAKGAKSSPTTQTTAARANSGGMSRIAEGTRYGSDYNPSSKGSNGASWLMRGAKSSPTTSETAGRAHVESTRKAARIARAKSRVNDAMVSRINGAKGSNGSSWLMRGAKSSPTTQTTAARANSGGMSRVTEGTRYGTDYNPSAKSSRGAQWITRGAKSSPTTTQTAMNAYDEYYRNARKKKSK